MANYLPVLLVSVGANTIPDDSSLSTLPRGQVDYLSHNWEEEDVWLSWRNMTRQKNEITNGVRLENASWRTWWKQRNGLGTVTPETLNWLKDSDVTWLYGPLHTAVDWSPPPKPDTVTRTSALDLLTTHKPILKHRSISQLLTSDFLAPMFSSTESEESDDAITPQVPPDSITQNRPFLTHTKSDTHITRWGPNRAYRKDSPPRIDPPARTPRAASSGYSSSNLHAPSPSSILSSDYFSTTNPAGPQKRRHISFNTFVEQCIAIEKPKKDGNGEDDDDDDYVAVDPSGTVQQVACDGRNAWGSDDGYEEDEEADSNDEDEALSVWDERFGGSAIEGSDSDSCDDAAVEDEEYDDDRVDNERMTIRSSIHNNTRPSLRSQSLVSSSSASTSTSTDTSSTSSQPSSRRNRSSPSSTASQRRFSTSTARPRIRLPPSGPPTPRRRRRAPPLIRTLTATSNSDHHSHGSPPPTQHATIAPIAPTILKTGGYVYGGSGWVEGFGDDGGSDDGILSGVRCWGAGQDKGVNESLRGSERDSDGEDEGSPVELVYLPPLGSNYSIRGREREFVYARQREVQQAVEVMEDHEDGLGHGEQGVYRRRHHLFSVGVMGDDEVDVDVEGDMDNAASGHIQSPRISPLPIPTVVGPEADDAIVRDGNVRGRDAYDYFGGPDLGEDFSSRGRNPSGRRRRGSEGERGRPAFSIVGTSSSPVGEAERSRSRSKSRTPSPAVIPSSNSGDSVTAAVETTCSPKSSPHLAVPARSGLVPVRRSASASPPYTQALLSPPPRGRGSSSQQDLQVHARGRSSTRNSSTTFDREGVRDRSSVGSPLGSVSPDGVGLVGVGGVYANGRVERGRGDRERGSDGEGERTRGRDRTGKRLSHSLSPDDFPVLSTSPASTVPSAPAVSAQVVSPVVHDTPPVKPADEAPSIPVPAPERAKAEETRSIAPTPSNSPAITLQRIPATIAHAGSPSKKPPTSPKGRSPPLTVPAPLPAEPSTSYSISPPAEHYRPPVSPSSPRSPRSPTRGEGTIVGKAVDMVSSAGAFLGFWHHDGNDARAA